VCVSDLVVSFFLSSRRRHTRSKRDWSSDVCSSDLGELLGHSMYFYTKDTGRAVKYTAPAFAMDVSKEVPKFRKFNAKEHGCQLRSEERRVGRERRRR